MFLVFFSRNFLFVHNFSWCNGSYDMDNLPAVEHGIRLLTTFTYGFR